ncbi:hypothetical protein C8A01DRAFT_39614 [Parachaetomium inaequale]|uniref:Cytochrome P450 n=1 Tax=Parachaetomium inaequale TaxID=2588326 RepID=A0AAN6P8W5_9PEZI|nr:hypothetical protein C8A01DRAFT_39614 [Parachaetomium inaequale]
MLALAGSVCLLPLLLFLFWEWRAWRVQGTRQRAGCADGAGLQEWVREQRNVAGFRFAGRLGLLERLRLRATENGRLRAAFKIDNSLTTASLSVHKDFLQKASWLLRRENRSWDELYSMAQAFLKAEVETAVKKGQHNLRLAESVRCMVLAVVLFDSFGVNPASIPRADLVTITNEINKQWLRSKRQPTDATSSQLLNSAIASLNITSPFPGADHAVLSPAEILGLLMPQYETLWRVVLLTFLTAYHHQPDAHPDAAQRAADVPACLGDPNREKEALKLAKEGLRLYPSNKHLYRSSLNPTPPNTPPVVAADISALHRHPYIWGGDALAFRPSRFDKGVMTDLQREAYIPFSVAPHKCPAAGNAFGERMVAVLVVALGRGWGPERGRVVFGGGGGGGGEELPTGRDEMEEWVWESDFGGRGLLVDLGCLRLAG